MSYTPTSVNATIQLLNNQGLSLSTISSAVSSFNATTLSTAFLAAVAAADTVDGTININKPALLTFGADYLPGLLGTIPTTALSVLGSVTYPNKVLTQAQLVFPGSDISSFAQNLMKASGATLHASEIYLAALKASTKSWNEYGKGIEKFSDIATLGFARLVGNTGLSLSEIGDELKKLGTSQNLKDIQAYADEVYGGTTNATTFVKNLVSLGGGSIGNIEQQVIDIIPIARLDEYVNNKFAQARIKGILDAVTDKDDLSELKIVLGVDHTVPITKASDLLDPVATVEGLSDKLNRDFFIQLPAILKSIPGGDRIRDFADLGEMCKAVDTPISVANIDGSGNFVDYNDLNLLKGFIPIMADDEAGPQVTDLIGVCGSSPTINGLTNARTSQIALTATTQGQSILTSLTNLTADLLVGVVDTDYTTTPLPISGLTIADYKTAIQNQMLLLMLVADSSVQTHCLVLGEQFSNEAMRLANQITSLSRMAITLTDVLTANKMSLMSFGRAVGGLASDQTVNDILVNLCTTNSAGEAVKLHLIEKRNLAVFQKFGLNPPNFL